MADPACVHCAGLGELIENSSRRIGVLGVYPVIVCDCDGACQDCGGRGYTFARDDFDGDGVPIECAPCHGTGRDPHHDAKEARA